MQNVLHTIKRHQTLSSHKIKVLPIAILMPHGACNCRCVMCDIWKGNKNAKQLTEEDVKAILVSLKKLDTKRVVMSGGEALLNKNFFVFCEIIKKQNIKISLLSTGITISQHAEKIIELVDDVILSLDGDQAIHDQIRNITGAFTELKKGVQKLKEINPNFLVSARSVIHQLNYKSWDKLILRAKEMGLDRISFLPADVTSQAFNREELWEKDKQETVLIHKEELPLLQNMIQKIVSEFKQDFDNKFISESPEKIQKIHQYYAAHYGLTDFPYKKCNAPWVSTVIEADGSVRPCFFHDAIGSIKNNSLLDILNHKKSREYRQTLNTQTNSTCIKCVCYLNLSPRNKHY